MEDMDNMNRTNININYILQKCSKCRKVMPIDKFIKKNYTLKSCESCHQQSLNNYQALLNHDDDNNSNEVLLPEKIADNLFNKIVVIGTDEYFENERAKIEFKSNIIL